MFFLNDHQTCPICNAFLGAQPHFKALSVCYVTLIAPCDVA